MHGVVKPPCPVIVPQVVVRVLVVQSDGQALAVHFFDNISINQVQRGSNKGIPLATGQVGVRRRNPIRTPK